MRKPHVPIAVAALLGTRPAQSIVPILTDAGFGHRGTGVGIAAGPAIALPDRRAINGLKPGQASFGRPELKSGYSTSFNPASESVLADLPPLDMAKRADDNRQGSGDEAAWISAVALSGLYIAASENSD